MESIAAIQSGRVVSRGRTTIARLLVRSGPEWLLLLAAADLPLLATASWSNPFELPKSVLLRLIAASLALLVITRLLLTDRPFSEVRSWRPSPVGAAMGSLVVAWCVANMFAVDPTRSFWGSYIRQYGTLALICLLALVLVAERVYRAAPARDRLLAVCLGTATIVALGVLTQFAGVGPYTLSSQYGWRAFATLGQPNLAGALLAMALPIALARALVPVGWRWLYVGVAVVILLGLLATGSRGALLGATLGVSLTLVVGWHGRSWSRLARNALVTIAAFASLTGGILLLHLFGIGPSIPTMLGLARQSNESRLYIVQSTLQLIVERPLLGYGAEALALEFDRYYPPALIRFEGRDVIVDRAHNEFLDAALAAGLPGVAATLALFAVVLISVRRATTIEHSTSREWQSRGLAGGLCAYVVQAQFGFAATATAVWFCLLAATASAIAYPQAIVTPTASTTRERTLTGWRGFTFGICVVLWAAFVVVAIVRPIAANAFYDRGLLLQSQGQTSAAAAAFRRAAEVWPYESLYHVAVANAELILATTDRDGRDMHYADAVSAIEHAIAVSPREPHHYLNRAITLGRWSLDGHIGMLPQAEAAYAEAVERSPYRGYYRRDWGRFELDRANWSAAEAHLRDAVALDPNDFRSFRWLGDALAAQSKVPEAIEAYRTSLFLLGTQEDLHPRIRRLEEQLGNR